MGMKLLRGASAQKMKRLLQETNEFGCSNSPTGRVRVEHIQTHYGSSGEVTMLLIFCLG